MIVHRAQHTQAFETPNGNLGTPLATPSLGATTVTVVRQCQRPGGFTPLHRQTHEEVMIMLSGTVTVRHGDQRFQLSAPDTLIVPPHTAHQISNTGATDAEWLIISPAGMQLLHDDGRAASPPWLK